MARSKGSKSAPNKGVSLPVAAMQKETAKRATAFSPKNRTVALPRQVGQRPRPELPGGMNPASMNSRRRSR